MAFPYEKRDPGPNGKNRWMARVSVGGAKVAVSLKLIAPEGKKLAEKRASDLQKEIDDGLLRDATKEWLGPAGQARIEWMIASASHGSTARPTTWSEAALAYIAACRAKDTKVPVAGSARTVSRTLFQRRSIITAIASHMDAQGVRFGRLSFTSALIEYIQFRMSSDPPISPVTIWGGEIGHGIPWGEWLHNRGYCEKPNRERIKEIMPKRVNRTIVIPSPSEDIAAITMFRERRHVDAGPDQFQYSPAEISQYRSAWPLVLCVRGIGCRPTEATTLTWPSIDLDKGIVTILDTKTGLARKVPILFQWVHDGLSELKRRYPRQSVVCCSNRGKAWSADSGIYRAIWSICRKRGVPVYKLKQAQKLHIAQLIADGFPPRVVAKWTGHTLSIQEKHYYQDDSYLPTVEMGQYGEFGKLTAWGEKVKKHLSSSVSDVL